MSRDAAGSDAERIVQRQQGVPPQRNHQGLLVFAENIRPRLFRTSLLILHNLALSPFVHRLRFDHKLPAQLRDRSLRSLYVPSDGVRGRRAAMTNLSHSASFHSNKWITPSNRGIRHQHRSRCIAKTSSSARQSTLKDRTSAQ